MNKPLNDPTVITQQQQPTPNKSQLDSEHDEEKKKQSPIKQAPTPEEEALEERKKNAGMKKYADEAVMGLFIIALVVFIALPNPITAFALMSATCCAGAYVLSREKSGNNKNNNANTPNTPATQNKRTPEPEVLQSQNKNISANKPTITSEHVKPSHTPSTSQQQNSATIGKH